MLLAGEMEPSFTLNYLDTQNTTNSGPNVSLTTLLKKDGSYQRLIVNDGNGSIEYYSLKNDSLDRELRLPLSGKGLTAVSPAGQGDSIDKLFVAQGTNVKGFSRKGKEFFELQTNFTEPLRLIAVDNIYLFTTGEYILNRFDNGVDSSYVPLPSKPLCLVLDHIFSNEGPPEVIVGCEDGIIRLVSGDHIIDSFDVDGAVTCLSLWEPYALTPIVDKLSPHYISPLELSRFYLYGTRTGSFGVLMYGSSADSSDSKRSLRSVFSFSPESCFIMKGSADVEVDFDVSSNRVQENSLDPSRVKLDCSGASVVSVHSTMGLPMRGIFDYLSGGGLSSVKKENDPFSEISSKPISVPAPPIVVTRRDGSVEVFQALLGPSNPSKHPEKWSIKLPNLTARTRIAEGLCALTRLSGSPLSSVTQDRIKQLRSLLLALENVHTENSSFSTNSLEEGESSAVDQDSLGTFLELRGAAFVPGGGPEVSRWKRSARALFCSLVAPSLSVFVAVGASGRIFLITAADFSSFLALETDPSGGVSVEELKSKFWKEFPEIFQPTTSLPTMGQTLMLATRSPSSRGDSRDYTAASGSRASVASPRDTPKQEDLLRSKAQRVVELQEELQALRSTLAKTLTTSHESAPAAGSSPPTSVPASAAPSPTALNASSVSANLPHTSLQTSLSLESAGLGDLGNGGVPAGVGLSSLGRGLLEDLEPSEIVLQPLLEYSKAKAAMLLTLTLPSPILYARLRCQAPLAVESETPGYVVVQHPMASSSKVFNNNNNSGENESLQSLNCITVAFNNTGAPPPSILTLSITASEDIGSTLFVEVAGESVAPTASQRFLKSFTQNLKNISGDTTTTQSAPKEAVFGSKVELDGGDNESPFLGTYSASVGDISALSSAALARITSAPGILCTAQVQLPVLSLHARARNVSALRARQYWMDLWSQLLRSKSLNSEVGTNAAVAEKKRHFLPLLVPSTPSDGLMDSDVPPSEEKSSSKPIPSTESSESELMRAIAGFISAPVTADSVDTSIEPFSMSTFDPENSASDVEISTSTASSGATHLDSSVPDALFSPYASNSPIFALTSEIPTCPISSTSPYMRAVLQSSPTVQDAVFSLSDYYPPPFLSILCITGPISARVSAAMASSLSLFVPKHAAPVMSDRPVNLPLGTLGTVPVAADALAGATVLVHSRLCTLTVVTAAEGIILIETESSSVLALARTVLQEQLRLRGLEGRVRIAATSPPAVLSIRHILSRAQRLFGSALLAQTRGLIFPVLRDIVSHHAVNTQGALPSESSAKISADSFPKCFSKEFITVLKEPRLPQAVVSRAVEQSIGALLDAFADAHANSRLNGIAGALSAKSVENRMALLALLLRKFHVKKGFFTGATASEALMERVLGIALHDLSGMEAVAVFMTQSSS